MRVRMLTVLSPGICQDDSFGHFRPHKHGFCKRDMVVHMRTVIATPWGWFSVCPPCLSSLFRKLPDSAFSGIRDPRDWVPDITKKSCPDSRIGITFCVASLPWIHVGRSLSACMN